VLISARLGAESDVAPEQAADKMKVLARTLPWLLVLSSSVAIAQGPAAGTAAQDGPPDAPTPIRGVEPTGMKTLTHYGEGVLVLDDVTLQGLPIRVHAPTT
jgi:hypothetical protein